MEGLGSSPVTYPHWGHKTVEKESPLAVEVSVNWAWGRRRGADRKTGAEDVGKAGSVEPGRIGIVLAGFLLGILGFPALPRTHRWGVV